MTSPGHRIRSRYDRERRATPPNQAHFRDRGHAGRELAKRLRRHARQESYLVAISSGGVRIGVEVSKELGLPIRFLPVAGTRLAGQDEILAGAVAATGEHVFDDTALALAAPASPSLDQSLRNAEAKARRCRRRQQADHVAIPERAETILVSDGLDPDVCLRTAAEALRRRGTNHVTFAVPCHTERTLERARAWADLVVTAVPTDAGPTALAWYAALSPVPMSSVPALLRSCS